MTTIQDRPTEAPTPGPPPPAATGTHTLRIGGVFGIAFVVITFGVLMTRGMAPLWSDPVDTIRTYWTEDGDRYLVSQYVLNLATVILFSGFLVVLSLALEQSTRTVRGLARLVVLAGGMHIVFTLAADAAWATLASAAPRLDDQSLLLLTALDRGAYHGAGLTFGMFVSAVAVAILAGDVFPRWLGVAACLPALGLIVSPLSILADGPDGTLSFVSFVSSVLTMLLIGVLSVLLLRGARPARSGPTEA